MEKLHITVGCSPSDRSRPVLTGDVPIEGCTAEPVSREASELLRMAARERPYDVTEMSMSSHLLFVDRGEPHYSAIPVFHSRLFRHSSIYINKNSGIRRPEDLRGKQVGLQQYQQTMALWVRGFLADDYGVAPSAVYWRTGGVDKPGSEERVPLDLPASISVDPIPSDRTLSKMLEANEIDALVSSREPSALASPSVERLFPDYRTVEADYYRRTGLFPIMHCIGVRRSLAEEYPWLPHSIYRAFCEARRRALHDLFAGGVLRVMLPWMKSALEDVEALMGPDFWPYGIEANLGELRAMTRYAHEQGLTSRELDLAELFDPSLAGALVNPESSQS